MTDVLRERILRELALKYDIEVSEFDTSFLDTVNDTIDVCLRVFEKQHEDCGENKHNMKWVCIDCGLQVDNKHSHKTCISRFDERVKESLNKELRVLRDKIREALNESELGSMWTPEAWEEFHNLVDKEFGVLLGEDKKKGVSE